MSDKKNNIFIKSLITRKVSLPFYLVGNNIDDTLHDILLALECKCIKEGYVKKNSIKILTHSSGILKGGSVEYEVLFEVLICRPVEGMKINCVVKNITKAGIRAETGEDRSPIVVFVARDHYFKNAYFTSRKEKDPIIIKVIGTRFELNDKFISIIADLFIPSKES